MAKACLFAGWLDSCHGEERSDHPSALGRKEVRFESLKHSVGHPLPRQVALVVQYIPQVVDVGGDAGVLGTVGRFVDGQRPLVGCPRTIIVRYLPQVKTRTAATYQPIRAN